MDKIEPLIQSNPKAAQRHLDSLIIAEPDIKNKEPLHARFILLNAYTKYRNYEISEADSTLLTAEQYYNNHGTDYERMLCKFLIGTWYCDIREMNNIAITKIKEALKEDHTQKLYHLRGQSYSYLHKITAAKGDTTHVKYAKLALDNYLKDGNEDYIIEGYTNMGCSYTLINEYPLSIQLLNKALQGSIEQLDSFSIKKALNYLAEAYTFMEQSDSAILYFETLRRDYDYDLNNRDYDLLALAYSQKGDMEKAFAFLDSSLAVITEEQIKENLSIHYEIEAQIYEKYGNKEKVSECLDKVTTLNKEIHKKNYKELEKQRDELFEENKEREASIAFNKDINRIAIISAIPILAATIILIRVFRKKKRRLEHIEQTLKANNGIYEQIDSTDVVKIIKSSECVKLIQSLAADNQVMNKEMRKELDQLFEQHYPSFNKKLERRIDYNFEKRTICQLQKLKFKNIQIANLLAKTPNAISNISKRNCNEYLGEDGSASKWKEIIDSL